MGTFKRLYERLRNKILGIFANFNKVMATSQGRENFLIKTKDLNTRDF